MAKIGKVEMRRSGAILTVRVSDDEWHSIYSAKKDIVIFPMSRLVKKIKCGSQKSGKRFFLSNGTMERHKVGNLDKKLPMNIFESGDFKVLCIALKDRKQGLPKWEKGEKNG